MSRHDFSDDCPGCRPVIADPTTMKPLPDDDPAMKVLNAVWARTTFGERRALHRVWCQNSRRPADLEVMTKFQHQLQAALDALKAKRAD